MHYRPPEEQNRHKVTCGVHGAALQRALGTLQSHLDAKGVKANVITSGHGDWRCDRRAGLMGECGRHTYAFRRREGGAWVRSRNGRRSSAPAAALPAPRGVLGVGPRRVLPAADQRTPSHVLSLQGALLWRADAWLLCRGCSCARGRRRTPLLHLRLLGTARHVASVRTPVLMRCGA